MPNNGPQPPQGYPQSPQGNNQGNNQQPAQGGNPQQPQQPQQPQGYNQQASQQGYGQQQAGYQQQGPQAYQQPPQGGPQRPQGTPQAPRGYADNARNIAEKRAFHINGYAGLILVIVVIFFALGLLVRPYTSFLGVILIIVALIFGSSLTTIQPNQAKVLTFFGTYVGTIREAGLFMTIPLTHKQTVSLRVRNFASDVLKVNDEKGNPVEIAAVVVYRVVDTARAIFGVDRYLEFVRVQSESAIRHVASEYPYDTFSDENVVTLRGNATEVSSRLTEELQERMNVAGIQIIETRLAHLAYATEIAGAMLQRQQSTAILAAKKVIVDGAVEITEGAIRQLTKDTGLELTSAQQMQIVNNIMVAIISERGAQPVINTSVQSTE